MSRALFSSLLLFGVANWSDLHANEVIKTQVLTSPTTASNAQVEISGLYDCEEHTSRSYTDIRIIGCKTNASNFVMQGGDFDLNVQFERYSMIESLTSEGDIYQQITLSGYTDIRSSKVRVYVDLVNKNGRFTSGKLRFSKSQSYKFLFES